MDIAYYTSNSACAGLTYGEWTVRWWKWVLSIPAYKSPVVDETGKNASENQQKDVWFLAGVLADENEDKKFPSRICIIPADSSILIPVLNYEVDSMYYPELKNDQDILDHVLKKVQSIEKREFYLNDKLIPVERVHSDPQIFDLYVHPDFDRFHNGGNTRGAADGYWVFLKPLPKGEYNIQFSGSCERGRLKSGASYKINII